MQTLFLQNVPFEILNGIYYAMQVLSFPILACFSACYAPQYSMSRKKGALYALSVYIVLFALMYLVPTVLRALGISDSINSSRCFLFVLIPAAFFARLTDVDALQGSDFVIPSLFAARAIGKVGCAVVGCCHGFPCDWGVYSPVANARVFPLQLLEVTFCVIMATCCVLIAKHKQYHANGYVYGLAMTIFGIERYFIQFLTTDYQFAIGFNMQSVYAIIMTLLGLLVIYLADRKSHKV